MSTTELWVNDDGLEVRFGSEKAAVRKGGRVPAGDGDLHEVRVRIDGTDIPATDAPVDKKITIPSGAYIDSALLYVTTAFAGTGSLDLGFMNDDGDGTYSTNDDDGVDASIAMTALVDDLKVTCDGADIATTLVNGTSVNFPLVPSYGYQGSAATAGVAELVIKYRLQ